MRVHPHGPFQKEEQKNPESVIELPADLLQVAHISPPYTPPRAAPRRFAAGTATRRLVPGFVREGARPAKYLDTARR